ncbi:MAG: DUF5103 domain-containing protein [Bacteroidales bacterium]|nr:DUF5103 domain-containing protein [Bacteroidales bacterium]MCF8387248.1 DUF5103 domain-containing protein [Bacteroidales bacterium]MCF8396687.1 DUF5103 domain-containing protein [Bacteroidales bacterium]
MIIKTLIFITAFSLGPVSNSIAQQNGSDNKDTGFVLNTNWVYKDNIKTVILEKSISEGSYPVIKLQAGEKLQLEFDDLQAGVKDYQYTVFPCNFDWSESDLKPYEYLEGFQTDLIENFESSLGTDYPYTHYSIEFPTEYLQITKSGNYILQVFEKNLAPQTTIITYRFFVEDPQVGVSGVIKKALSSSDEQGYNQRLEIAVDLGNMHVVNPSQNLNLVVLQNGRWDNGKFNIKPTTLIGNKAEYYNNEKLVFKSGNEFRFFDIKDFDYHTDDVRSIKSTPMGYVVDLSTDKRRTFQQYYSEQDQNGRFMIRTKRGRDPAFEADYAEVNFYLAYDYPIGFGDLYLIGQLSNWVINPATKLTYNFNRKQYETTLLLKQGYYDYQYGFVEKGKVAADVSFIEGNYVDTENEYMVLVYYREPGNNYDQLIGSAIISK